MSLSCDMKKRLRRYVTIADDVSCVNLQKNLEAPLIVWTQWRRRCGRLCIGINTEALTIGGALNLIPRAQKLRLVHKYFDDRVDNKPGAKRNDETDEDVNKNLFCFGKLAFIPRRGEIENACVGEKKGSKRNCKNKQELDNSFDENTQMTQVTIETATGHNLSWILRIHNVAHRQSKSRKSDDENE